jgi:maltose O-acetyltransferase
MNMESTTEKEKMLAGELYTASDPELKRGRLNAQRITRLYNNTTEDETENRKKLLLELF